MARPPDSLRVSSKLTTSVITCAQGPDSRAKAAITVGSPSELIFYLEDNIWETDSKLRAEQFFNALEDEGKRQVILSERPFPMPTVTTAPAREAYELVLVTVGASRPRRDPVDSRLIRQERERSGRLINSQSEVGGWPELRYEPSPVDSDHDGVPDAWETFHGLDPRNPRDNARVLRSGYTAIEEYLNELARL